MADYGGSLDHLVEVHNFTGLLSLERTRYIREDSIFLDGYHIFKIFLLLFVLLLQVLNDLFKLLLSVSMLFLFVFEIVFKVFHQTLEFGFKLVIGIL